jgi:hypothetical protein
MDELVLKVVVVMRDCPIFAAMYETQSGLHFGD